MTLVELKNILNQLPPEYDDYVVIFGTAFSGFEIGNIEVAANWLEFSI